MKIINLIKISRPIGWIILPLIFYIGLVVSGAELSFSSILIMILLSFPISLAGYGINDVYDYKSDRINPRKKSIEGYIVSPKDKQVVKKLSIIILSIFFFSTLLTGNLLTIGVAVVFIFLGYFYSVPPVRLKERPPIDSLLNGLIYLLLPFLLGFSISGSFTGFPLKKILWLTLCVAAIHAIGTMMDFNIDKKTGVKTFAVKFGQRTTAILVFTIFLLTLLFGQFNSLLIRIGLLFCTTVTFLLVLFPTERFSRVVFKLIFIGFLILVSSFLLVLMR